MKKINIYFASVIVSLAVSCTAEKALEPIHTSFMKFDFVASADDVLTKTSLGEDHKTVSWTEGDQISVFSLDADNPANNPFALKEGETAMFSGEIEEGTQNIVAVYPYAATNNIDKSSEPVVNALIPDAQTATKDSFSNGSALMFYSGPLEATLAFKNITAVVSFVLPEELGMVNSVKVSAANSSAIAGNVSVDMEGNVSTADATVIELAGDFEGANTYYFAMLPGEYKGGLLFEVATEGGNKFYRQNTRNMVLAAGTVNKVGTLSLVMDTEMLTPAVTLVHTFDGNGVLTGTKVEASVAVPSEFASLLSDVSWTAELVNASDDDVAVRTVSGTGFTAALMSVANGFVYLPAGEYTLKLTSFAYKACGVERSITNFDDATATATATAPTTLNFKAITKGYTSYDVYANTAAYKAANTSGVSGAEEANKLNGSTIYNFSATLDETSGISEAIKNQMGVPSFQPTINGKAATVGDVSSITWGAAQLGGIVTFDRKEYATVDNSTAPVVGLPIKDNKVDATNWIGQGNYKWLDSGVQLADAGKSGKPSISLKPLHIPDDIFFSLSSEFRIKTTALGGTPTLLIDVGNLNLSQKGPDRGWTDKWGDYKIEDANGTFSVTNSSAVFRTEMILTSCITISKVWILFKDN